MLISGNGERITLPSKENVYKKATQHCTFPSRPYCQSRILEDDYSMSDWVKAKVAPDHTEVTLTVAYAAMTW